MEIASRISAILKFDTETGGDPFVKVKSLITESTNQLQVTFEWLDRDQLAEKDKLELGQARDSEHFPVKKDRNLNPESEVFMARIFQIWVSHSGVLGQDPGVDRFPTRRTDQSKARQARTVVG